MVVQVMNNVPAMEDGKRHWRETFERVAVVQSMEFHQDFEMCILLMGVVDVLFHTPLIWYVDGLMMKLDPVNVVAMWTRHGFDWL